MANFRFRTNWRFMSMGLIFSGWCPGILLSQYKGKSSPSVCHGLFRLLSDPLYCCRLINP